MLFTTATFAFLYLPLTLAGFFAIGRFSHWGAATWLLAASLVFYGYWMPEFTGLLVLSIAVNFAIGLAIQRERVASPTKARRWLLTGLVFDLALLAWFKYANFFVQNLGALTGTTPGLGQIVLPIGISFYTFTQIAYLVDTYHGKVGEARPVHYGLFVTYFPHLVAGPVLHHAQMMPQFGDREIYRPQLLNMACGLLIFAIGLTKKVVFADGVSPYADAVFVGADGGSQPGTMESWLGAVSYTLQLYFDFSGYSDMAIGLSLMFNIRLPFNFNSPYRSLNISEFWRRWHISLSTFLRDYLYVPLGGNRRGPTRRYANLMITMLLGGLWHGASWTFVAWGALHGLYLTIHQGFRAVLGDARLRRLGAQPLWRFAGWLVTMVAVVVAWVLFRATTFDGAGRVLTGMLGTAASPDPGLLLWNQGLQASAGWAWCLLLGAVACLAPNSNEIGTRAASFLRTRRLLAWAVASGATVAAMLLVVLNVSRDSVSAFIYFNF